MRRTGRGRGVALAVLTAAAMVIAGIPFPGLGARFGAAWAAQDSVDEVKVKSLEALEAIARALQEFADKAKTEAQGAADRARENLRSSVEKACDAALHACEKVCGDDAKCLSACKEGRHQCLP